MNLKRPLLVIAVTAVLAGTAAACGDDDDAASDTTDVVTTEPGVDTTEPASPTDEETTVPDSSEPATSGPSSSTPGDCPAEPTEESADELLTGLTEDEATEAAEACGWILRVVRRDGEDLPVTLDFRPNRVNVEVTAGEVTAIVNTG
jgi:hypothetical protein